MEANDTVLLDLLPFLEALQATSVSDVRQVVRSYAGQDIPSTFKCGPLAAAACTRSGGLTARSSSGTTTAPAAGRLSMAVRAAQGAHAQAAGGQQSATRQTTVPQPWLTS